jgi:hypothetical protein
MYDADTQKGISCITLPIEEDMNLAGYFKLHLWCSSSSNDMAIKAVIRVLDDNDKEVPYDIQLTMPKLPGENSVFPLAQGSLKVSHRMLDVKKINCLSPLSYTFRKRLSTFT